MSADVPQGPGGIATRSAPSDRTLLDAFLRHAQANPRGPALVYFDRVLTFDELGAASDALAVGLHHGGVHVGDRVALYMQNMPQYVITLLAVWKLGAAVVPVNPMLTPTEVVKLLGDACPRALVLLDELHTAALAEALSATSVERVITTSALDWQSAGDTRVLPAVRLAPEGTCDLQDLIARSAGQRPPVHRPEGEDVAVITYTSGTTGKPKGAMNTHRNVATGGQIYCEWFGLDSSDVILGVAPLFHVTGLTGHIAAALTAGAPLVLAHRFHLDVMVDMIRRHRPTFTVGALTVFIALIESAATKEDLASLTTIASGGAPVAAGVLERFRCRFDRYIHNVYGMTETTCPVLGVPVGTVAPVEPQTSALSVGKPMLATVVVLDDEGRPVDTGEVGEVAVSGPQIVPGYWQQPEQTTAAIRDGLLLTGDVGYVDEDGWFYLVDRKKDMIVASGYKVWPREVEDVLYTHDAVREAAVVGQPHPYRGETVKAFVSLRDGHTVGADELISFCRERMAAYKYPREVEIVDAIPKTATGKVLRRALRQEN